jgi:N utilization substance protein A
MDLLNIINQVGKEKGINREKLIEVVKDAVISASKKRLGFIDNLEAVFNEKTGEIDLFVIKKVVDKVAVPENEISMKDAVNIKADAKLNDTVMVPCSVEGLGRIAAQSAKQVILQRIRDAERESVFNEYKDKKGGLLSGMVLREDRGDIIVDLGKTEGIIYRREQSFRENLKRGDRITAYVIDIKKNTRGPQVILSRTHPGLLIKLFEMEVPEITDGIVAIKGAARDIGGRSKIAVSSNKKDVDPVGACVGMRGIRVQSIVQELRGEKIDIVEWSEDPAVYVKNALAPAKTSNIIVNANEKSITVIVPDDQLSLAIGKKGQNVKLAVKLLHWKIDIKSESEYKKESELPEKEVVDEDETVKKQPQIAQIFTDKKD